METTLMLGPDRKLDEVLAAFHTLFGDFERGYAEIRLLDPEKVEPAIIKWFPLSSGTAEMDVIEFVSPYEGKRNAYIGRAPRSREGSDEAAIDFVTSISFDVDPIRPKNSPSTVQEFRAAEHAALRIAEASEVGELVHSGNGTQVWVPLKSPVDIRGRRDWWKEAHRRFEEAALRRAGAFSVVQVDNQFDIPRLVCLPGFLKVKGEEDYAAGRLYRPAQFADRVGPSRHMDPERILAMAPSESEPAMRRIVSGPALPVPARFWRVLNDDPRLYEAYNGERRDLADPSNSTQNMALVNRLRHHGFSRDEASAILQAAPSLKARANSYYLDLTLRKVYGA